METATLKYHSNGCPMLMHSDRLANPLDPALAAHQELTSTRKKTPEIHLAIAHSQFIASLYTDKIDGVSRIVMPSANLRKSLIEGARLNKLGKGIERGVVFMAQSSVLNYDGAKDPEKLWEDTRFRDSRMTVVSRARVLTTRPRFDEWSCEAEIIFDPSQIELGDIEVALKNAGNFIGIGDYRPLFGRYEGVVK